MDAYTELEERLDELVLRDRRRLARRLSDLRRGRGSVEQFAAQVVLAEEHVAQRRASVPPLDYPPQLPVSQVREDIAAAIAEHQVVVLAGETGSGKTTQLPKILLGLGRGVMGVIGHTQPRRIAARAVAERVAEELGTELGDVVGYTVRFHDQVSEATLVKVMTDGILLAEISRDRMLWAYDTIVIDEAHERSLTIDFLLGYLKQLLPQRPDLKLIITSATIDPERFSRHFNVGTDLPRRGALPATGAGRRSGPGHLRRRRRAGPGGPRGRTGVPVRRARDPGHRRRSARVD